MQAGHQGFGCAYREVFPDFAPDGVLGLAGRGLSGAAPRDMRNSFACGKKEPVRCKESGKWITDHAGALQSEKGVKQVLFNYYK